MASRNQTERVLQRRHAAIWAFMKNSMGPTRLDSAPGQKNLNMQVKIADAEWRDSPL